MPCFSILHVLVPPILVPPYMHVIHILENEFICSCSRNLAVCLLFVLSRSTCNMSPRPRCTRMTVKQEHPHPGWKRTGVTIISKSNENWHTHINPQVRSIGPRIWLVFEWGWHRRLYVGNHTPGMPISGAPHGSSPRRYTPGTPHSLLGGSYSSGVIWEGHVPGSGIPEGRRDVKHPRVKQKRIECSGLRCALGS